MSSSAVITPELARKNRRLLILLLLSFVLPFVVGHFAYVHGWFKGGQTNKGELLAPPADFLKLGLRNDAGVALTPAFLDRKWWLVYVLPADCQQACRNSLYQMRQVRLASGREADRIKLLLVQPQVADAATEALLAKEFADMARVRGDAAALDAGLAGAGAGASQAGRSYIMDPLGILMLSYPPEADEKTSVIKSDNMLDDLKKLLKASQIG